MHNLSRLGLSITFLILASIPLKSEAESVSDALVICSNETNSLKRLVCFDRVVQQLRSYQGGNEALLSKPQRTTAPPVSAVPPVNTPKTPVVNKESAVDSFGLPQPSEDESYLVDGDLYSTIKKVLKPTTRRFQFVLANGQIWEKTEGGDSGLPRVGDKIVIRRQALGAFYLRKENVNRSFQVKRIEN